MEWIMVVMIMEFFSITQKKMLHNIIIKLLLMIMEIRKKKRKDCQLKDGDDSQKLTRIDTNIIINEIQNLTIAIITEIETKMKMISKITRVL